VRAVEEFKKTVHQEYSIMGWIEGPAAEAADLRSSTNFLVDLALDAPFACELMDLCVAVGIEFARAQLEAGADTIGVGDAIASQVSPGMYAELIFPREQRLFDGVHDAGGFIRLHICGDTTHLLPYFAKLHVDIIDLDWQVDMARARQVIGSDKVLVGNLDPVSAVKLSTPEQIREGILDIHETVGNPYMVGAGCEIPPGTPNENLKALCEPVPFT
jgi:MtaA/CmuA family methyltransferase